MEVRYPCDVPSTANMRLHWAKKAQIIKKQRSKTLMFCRAYAPRLQPPLAITLVRCAPRPIRDGDNLHYAFKAIRDGVADFLGIDDKDTPLLTWRYAQETSKTPVVVVRFEVHK